MSLSETSRISFARAIWWFPQRVCFSNRSSLLVHFLAVRLTPNSYGGLPLLNVSLCNYGFRAMNKCALKSKSTPSPFLQNIPGQKFISACCLKKEKETCLCNQNVCKTKQLSEMITSHLSFSPLLIIQLIPKGQNHVIFWNVTYYRNEMGCMCCFILTFFDQVSRMHELIKMYTFNALH